MQYLTRDEEPRFSVGDKVLLPDEEPSSNVQFATVDPSSGWPSVRTVVFRGFLPSNLSVIGGKESCVLTFITDTRSEKVRHLREAWPEPSLRPRP